MHTNLVGGAFGARAWAITLLHIDAARLPGTVKQRLAVSVSSLVDWSAFELRHATPAGMGSRVTDQAHLTIGTRLALGAGAAVHWLATIIRHTSALPLTGLRDGSGNACALLALVRVSPPALAVLVPLHPALAPASCRGFLGAQDARETAHHRQCSEQREEPATGVRDRECPGQGIEMARIQKSFVPIRYEQQNHCAFDVWGHCIRGATQPAT